MSALDDVLGNYVPINECQRDRLAAAREELARLRRSVLASIGAYEALRCIPHAYKLLPGLDDCESEARAVISAPAPKREEAGDGE